jgi:hypothetical protein
MDPKRPLASLALCLIVLAGGSGCRRESGSPAIAPAAGAGQGGGATPAQAAQTQTGTAGSVPEVKLGELSAKGSSPTEPERNVFRFGERAQVVPVSPGRLEEVPDEGESVDAAPALPPPPPILLKFIGIVEATSPAAKLAVLSDGRDIFYGREGDIIDGRYRVARIGVESIELERVDGRGRQTIRLTGS